MANIFDDPFAPADMTAADTIFQTVQPRTVVSPGLTSFDQSPLDGPMSELFSYDEPIDVRQSVRAALSTDEQEAMDDVFDSFLPKEGEDSAGLLSSPKSPKEGPTEFQKRNINWSDGGRSPTEPVAYPASDADFLEVDYMFGKKEGASDKPVLAANVFGRQFTAEELNRDTEGRKLLDLMQKRRSGEYQKGGVLVNLAKGFTDWSKSDIPYYGWVSDIGASAGEAIEISETMRRLQDGKVVTPHQVLQARRFMLQQELEAQRTAAYQIGSVARQAIPFMAEMFAESMAVAGIVGAATGGVGAIPGAIVGAAIAPAKLLLGMFRKGAPKAIAKVTDKAIARYAAKGLTYGVKDLAEIGAKGTEVYGSRAARREAFRAFRDQARKSFADAGVSATERQVSTEATRLMADALSRRAPENLSPRVAARMIYGADYRTGAETAITKGLEEMALKATGMDAAEFAKLSGRARAKKIAEGWAKIGQADRDNFLKSLLEGLKRDAKGNVVSGIKGFSSASVKGGMESTTGLLVSEKYARSVADQVARQVMNVFDLRYGDRTLSHFQRFGGWFGEHVTRGFLQSEHAYFAGGLPTIGHAGFSSFHLSSDALKEGLGRVFVEAPIQGAMNAAIGPLAMAPIFAAASGHDAGDAVFKGQLGFQANALLTGDRKNMETARQCAIGSLFVEYMSESAGRGLGLMAGGALASNPVARAVLGTKANPVTGTTASVVGATKNVWDAFLSRPLTKQAGSLLSRATEAVYGFGRMGVDKYAGLATTYVTKLVKAANKKGVAGTVTQAEIRNAVTSNSLEGLNGAVRGILAKEGIRNAKQLARRVALDASQGDRVKALTNVLGLRLAQHGLTPDEIVRKFRQMGKGNIIEEMGEERLGDFVRGLFHLDDTASDADINEHLKSMFSGFRDPEQLMVEFFGFAWPGIVRSGMMRAQRWISTGALAEARERSQRIQNVMDIMGSSNAAISVMADERRQQAIEEHTARGAQLLVDALGTAEQNGQAVVANSKATFDGRADLVANVQAAGGLQAPASNPVDGPAVPGTSDYNNSMAKVQAVAAAKTEAETVDEMAKLAQSYMQYSTEAELEDALKQTGAEVIFGTEGVKAIRREWRKVEGHSFAAGHEVEKALDAYKTHMNTAPARAPAATTVDGLANQIRVESPIFASDSGLTAGQREGLSQDSLPLVDEGIVSQLDEDLKELARNVNRAALSIDGDLGWARKTISKIVGLVGAATTGDISLAMMNPAAWAARDSGLSPQMLVATNGYYVESLIDGFKKLRVGENGLETKIAEKLNSVVESGGNFAQAIRRAVESGEMSTQTFDAMEAAGADLFDSRVKRLAESVLAGSGILMVAQDQQNEAVLSYVANRHKRDDRDGVTYVLKDGTTVDDFHDGRFAEDYVDEIQKTRDDLVDELLRLAGDRDALRFQRGAMLGTDRPFFAIDVVRAIKNGTKAEMLGAILSLPAFRDMAKVLNVSGLTEYERETLFSAMNCKDVDLTALANIDDSKDLDGKDEAFVASAMGRNNSKYTTEENQKAMKDFVRRCRLLYRGGLTTFEDRDGEGRVAHIVPENVAGTRTYRAVVYKAGETLLDQTYTDFAAAQKAILDFGVETDGEGEISKWGFSEVPKNLVISDLNVITSTDSTSMVSYLFANDREELRRQYLYRVGGMEAVRDDMLVHDPNERTLPPYLRRKSDGSGWQIEGPDAAQKAAQMFRDELERARFYERNKGNVQLWGRGQSLTTEQRRKMMKDDAKVAESVKSYESLGDRILEANGVHRTATPGNQTLGLGNAWTAHLNYTTVRNGNTMVISPDFASDGHSEGMLRFGIRQALDSWRNLRDEDSTDRNLLLAYAYREFKRCGEELAARLERTDRTKAQRVRDVMRKVLRDDVAQIHTSSIAAIASSSVFFSCDRGLMQEGNGFLDSPELAAIADAFRATDVFPLFASAIDEALGGTGFFHQAGAGSVSGLSAWVDAFGRDGLALAKARTSTVFGDGKSARNPALVRYAIRADVTTPDMLDAGPITIDRKPGDQPTDVDANGLINSFGGENALMDYLKALSDSCVRFTEQYAGIRGASDVRLTTAQVYRMAVRSNMLGGAATASGGARAKVTANLLSLNTAAINEARNIEVKGMPYELTPETAQHFGAALRRIALSAGMSVTRGRTRLVNDLRNRNVPEDIIAKVEQAYNDTDLKSDLRRFEQAAEENRRKAKEESGAQDVLDEAESGRSDDGFKEERNIGGLVDNDDTTALSKLLRWYFPWEGGSVSATLSRVRESLLTGDMLTDEKMDRLVAKGYLTEEARANVKRFVEALSVMDDKTRFDENNAKSVFWSEDAAEVSEVLDDVTRVLSTMGKYDYAVAVAAIRNIPHNDGRRTKFLQMLAQMTVTDPVYLERDGEFNFSLDSLGTLVESDRTPNAIQDVYTSLLTVNTLTATGTKLNLTGKDPESLAKGICDALAAISYRRTADIPNAPTQWEKVNDLLRGNFVDRDSCPTFKYPGGKASYYVAVDAKDLAAVQAYLNGESASADDARQALDSIQALVWKRMQNMAEAVDRIFGTGTSLAAALRSRDALAYVRRQADKALTMDASRGRAERNVRREMLLDRDVPVPEADLKRELDRLVRIRESGVERLLQMANYFATAKNTNKGTGMWNLFHCSAFLSDVVQEPLAQLALRLGGETAKRLLNDGYLLGSRAGELAAAIAKTLAGKKDARQFVREQLRDIGMMKAATGRDVAKALTPEMMDTDREGNSMFDSTRIMDDQCLKVLVDAYVSSLPQSSRSLAGHSANRSEAAKNRSVMTLPSDLPADIRMECHELFNAVKVDGKSLRETLEENGGRWADGSRVLVTVVGAKDIDGTLVPKEYLAGILDKAIRSEFENGNPTHVLLPFFRADKPSCFAIRMPVHVATEWVKAVAADEKLMANLRPELAERIRTIKDSLDGKVPDYVLDLNDQLASEKGEEAMKAAIRGAHEGVAVSDIVADLPGFFTPEEVKQIETAVANAQGLVDRKTGVRMNPRLKVVSATRTTDPAFYAKKCVEFLRKNAEKPFTDPTRVNAFEVWSKHDGMPIREILEACKQYKCAPVMSFSISTLGNTPIEKGVLNYNDLLDKIEALVKAGVLEPKTTTIRIDPVLPGVTKMDDVAKVIARAKAMGIKKFVTSLVQTYDGSIDRQTGKDRTIVPALNQTVKEMTGAEYDWDRYYGRKGNGKVNFIPKAGVIREWAAFFANQMKEQQVLVQSCAMEMYGLKPSACLDPVILAALTKCDKAIFTEADGGYQKASEGQVGGRSLCGCLRIDGMVCRSPHDPCYSSCAYCYAGQFGKGDPIIYYNEDGSLVDRPLTRTEKPKKPGNWQLTPSKPGRERPTKKDQDKFNQLGGITKYVGFGKPGSSTDHYGKTTFKDIANKGEYKKEDIVGVSVNGRGANRLPLSSPEFLAELGKAVAAGVTFVADTKEYRDSSDYNIGEHELSKYLREAGYVEDNGSGVWRPKNVAPAAKPTQTAQTAQTVDRDSLYRAVFGLAMTAAGQADIDPKRVATTLSVGPYVPLYKPSDENDRDAACYFVSTLGGVTAASLTGAYQIVGRGSTNVKAISEGRPEAQKLHITSHTLGVNFKKGQGNDYGLGFDRDGQITTLSSVTYYQEQGRRELERILGLPEKILDPVDKPKASKDKDADKAKFDEWTKNVKAPHDDAVAKAKAFLDKSTVVLDDLETNKAGIFGSSFGFYWDGKSVFTVSLSAEKTNAATGEKTTETTTVSYDPDKKVVTDGDGNPLSGGWNVVPDAKNDQMPVMWVLSALCMAKKDGRLTNADVNGIVASWRKQNGAVVENATLKDLGVLADGDEFNVRNDGNGNAVVTFKTRNISAQVVANNANSAAPEYGHSFATNATRDMEMLEEIINAEHGGAGHDFVDAHAGYSMLKLAMLRRNPDLVSLACGQDLDLAEAYKSHPFDPEVRDTVAKKVNAFLRRESIIGFYGTHGVMCPSAGNGHSPVKESRGGHTVQIEWLPGTTQYDKDIFRPARIYNSIEEKFYGQSRSFGSGCVNVRARGFRYGLYLDEAKFDKLVAGAEIRDDFNVDAKEWAAVEGCSVQEAEKAIKLANFIRIATKDDDTRRMLLDCFVDYTGRSAAQSEGSRDARFDDLILDDGKFDFTAIGIGRSRRNSVNERDSAEGSIYLGGSPFCAHRSPSGNIEAFQGTVRAAAPINFDARTGRVGGEAKYALDPVTMLLQGSDTDGDSAGLQYWDYEVESDVGPEAIREFIDAVRKGEDAMDVAIRNGWTEVVEGHRLVKEDVFRAFTRAAFKAQVSNYRYAKTFHQGQQDEGRGAPPQSFDHTASDVWSGAEFVDYYEDSHPELLMTRGMDNEFVCDYGWAGRQPVGTDAVWDEPVEAADLVGLSKKASDILASLGDVNGMGYDKLLKKFVDAAKYGEKTSDLLDPEKSAMLSDAASDSAKARGISVFHQSRFLRALARAVVDDAKLDLVSADGYAPIIDLTSHFDGISNNLFDTLKMMFATRAGWTQQMLPFLLGQIVRHASDRERLGNAFFFVECANFLADLTRESTVSRLARYLHPTQGRQNILADAGKAKLKVSNYDSVTEIAEAFCRAKKIKIRDGVDKNGSPRSVTPRGKKALIVCANRMAPMTDGFDIEKSKAMQDKEREMLAIQSVLDDVREFGELVDYMVDAGRDTSGQYGILRKLDDVERDRSEVEEIQEHVVENFADFSTSFTDSVAQIEQLSRELDDLERPEKGEERAKWYAERREHPVATGVELAENMQRLSHLIGATQYTGAERASDFGDTTREFVENFADAVRYLSNEAWRRYDGSSNRLIGRFFRALEAKDGRIDVRAKQNEARVDELRAGFNALLASGHEFTMRYRRGDRVFEVKLPGSAVAALFMVHASATRPFGATTSYAGQSNLAAAFGDERIRGLESFAARYRIEDRYGYVRAARVMPVRVGGSKVYDFMAAEGRGLPKIEAKDRTNGRSVTLETLDRPQENMTVYRHLADNFGAMHRRVQSLKGRFGEHVTVTETHYAPTVAEWAGRELQTRTRFYNVADSAITAFHAYPGSKAYSSPEEAYNARLALEELNSLALEDEGEVRYLKEFYRDNGNRADADSGHKKVTRLTDIIADAAASDRSIYSTIANGGRMYLIHSDQAMTEAMNRVKNMIVDGSIAEPGAQQAKARMASEQGGHTDEDAMAVRADFLDRIADAGFRGASAEQLKKTIPQAIADGFKKAFGDQVDVSQVKNANGEPTNLLKVVRTMAGGRKITTYVSYGDVLGMDNVSRDSRIESILDMLNGRRAAEGRKPLTRADLEELSGHDLDALIESFRLAGCQAGQSEDAADLGFAPVMSGVIRLSTDAGFDTLFHEYFHQMLRCFSRFGVYDATDRADLESRFRTGDGAFDEEAAADAYARFVTGSVNGWDELKLRDYCATDERTIRIFDKFRTTATGIAEAMSRGPAESGLPTFVFATMFFGELTDEQAVRFTEPSDEQLAKLEDFLLKQRGQFAMTTGMDAGQLSRVQQGVANLLVELSKDSPDRAAVKAALDGVASVANEPVEPAAPVAGVREGTESYETIAGKTSQFLKQALTRFRRDGYDEHTEALVRRYMAERVNGAADASEVVYAARRLIREVAALEGYVLEDEDGNLTSTGKKLMDDHNVAELAMRLIANTEEERQSEAAGDDGYKARHAGADFTFARAMEHVAPRAYWRFCRQQAGLARTTFMSVADRLEKAADTLDGTTEENARLADSYRLQAEELRGLALRVVPLAMHVANGDDLHGYCPLNKNSGNLHGLLFKMFTGGAQFGGKHGSSDGISRYDASLGSDFHFDLADPTITAAFDYAAMAFFVAEAARKYSNLMDLNGRDRTVEGVGSEVEEETPEPEGEEPVAPEIAEGGAAERGREIEEARQARRQETLAELTYEPSVTPDWILSNPGVWLDQDLQKNCCGTDIRGTLTDHNVQAVCEEGYSWASMFNQTFGLETWIDDQVREMKRKTSDIGMNEEGDFAKVKGKRAATVFSNVNGALLGMIAWGEKRVGEKVTGQDIRMANWTGQVVKHLAARERRMITGVEIRSLAEDVDLERLSDEQWRTMFSPQAVIRRHIQSDEQKRQNPETALDVMLFRILTDVPAEVLGVSDTAVYLGDQLAGGLYFDVVEALARGKRNAEGMCDYAAGQTPAYQSYMVQALEDKYLVAKGGGRNFFAVPLNRSMAAWKTSEMYRKLKKAGRTDQLLNPYYWANTLAKQFRQINQAAAKSRYLTNGAGSNVTLAGTTSYWFFGGTGSHVMNVQKYQNAMQVIGDVQANAEDILRKKEATLFDIIENVDVATLNDLAFASDGSSLVKDRPLKYLAYMMGLTGHDDSTFDVQRFVRDICAGKYANADHGAPLYADMKVLDVYMAINRYVSERTLEELAKAPDMGPAKKQDLVDRMAVTEKISQLLQNTVPGTIVARTEEQEFAETGRLGDSATAGEALVRMCKEVVTAERFRGGLAQMLLTVANDGTPNYVVNPTDAVVAVAGLEDEYWGALARFAIRQLRFRFPSVAYDEGKSGVENMRAVYTLVKDTLVKPEDTRSEYHQMDVTRMRADRMFSNILARSTKLDAAGNDCILTDLQKGEADCYMRQLFAVLKAPSIDSKWQKLDRLMSWTKISSVGFSAFFNIATVFESATAATGFWHTVMGMTKTGSAVARGVGKAIGRKGGTGAFTSDAVFMKDLAQYINSDDPFVRKARELCDLIGMPLDFTLHFTNDRDNANPGLGQGGVVKGDIEKVVRWAEHAGFGAGKVRLLRKSLQFMYEHPTDYTFNVVLNAVKLSVVMQTMRRLREECLRGARPFDAIRELRRHSAYINAEIGGVDPARYAWATPEMRKILSLGMFSWQWTIGAWVAGGGEAITDAVFGGHSSSPAQRQRSFIRWLRMLGIVKFGVPVFLQAAVKALSKAMSAGLPPDDELTEEIDKMPWFCPLNESKVGSLCFDVTPLLKLAARVPGVAWTKENVPVIGSLIPAYVGGGRNTTGKRRYYMHFGKQSDEFFRWFEDPLSQALAKTSIPVQKVFEGIFGGLNPQGYRKAFAEKGLFDRVFNMNFSADENALVNLLSSMTSFSSQSISANPDAGFLAAVGPMKMGESKRSARLRIVARLREFIEDDRTNNPWSYAGNKRRLNLLCADIFREAQLNGTPPDKILSSALGDLTKEQYAKLMDALPKDLKVNRIDGEKTVEAIRALTRANKKYSDIKSSILQKYEAAGHDLKTSPAMRKAVLDVIRAARRDPLRFTGVDAEDLVDRYRAIVEQERRSTQMDDKGGENFGNFLATDDVPPTLFGVPVVSDKYTRSDLEFFKGHPEAGGFYEMGEEDRSPEPPGRGPGGRAADKGGDAGRPREKLNVSQYRNAQDRAVAEILNKAIDDGRTATGREMHAASFAAYADTPGAKMTEGELKAEARRRWRTAQKKRDDDSTLRNDYTMGKVTHVTALADGTDTGVYDPGARQAVAGTAPREEFVGHPTNNETTDRRTTFAKTFGKIGGKITNKDASGDPIGSLVNYVASAGDERNAAMSSIFPYAAGRTGNTMQTAEDLARFWRDMKSKARGFVDADPEHGADNFTSMLNLPWNGQGLVRAFLEADARVNPADGSQPDAETPEYKEAKELLDWLLNPEEMNKLTMSAKAEQKGIEVA